MPLPKKDPERIVWALTYPLVTLAVFTDGDLKDEEITATIDRVAEWVPDMPRERCMELVFACLNELQPIYNNDDFDQQDKLVNEALGYLDSHLDQVNKARYLLDLIHVALADGTLHENEVALIGHIAGLFNCCNAEILTESLSSDPARAVALLEAMIEDLES